MKKLAYINLGCPKNQIDLEIILGGLHSCVELTSDIIKADAVLINTCAFIEPAKQESIDEILNIYALQDSKKKSIYVSGCLSQRYKQDLMRELPEVDCFYTSTNPLITLRQMRQHMHLTGPCSSKRYLLNPSHYAYLQIAKGCSNRCSYCAIPLIKGDFKSRSLEEIENEARAMVEQGVKELILVAQDSTSYGKDLTDPATLGDVLLRLDRIADIRWIRLLYTHPAHWTDRLIDVMADCEHVLSYVDLPIQHISDDILKRMGRLVTRRDIETLIVKLRKRLPGLTLRTSVITGFPDETEKQFLELLEFIRDVQFNRLGVFTYSHEEGTRAFQWNDSVPDHTKRQRQEEIMQVQSDISMAYNETLLAQELEVVADEPLSSDMVLARTQQDAPEIDNSVLLNHKAVPGTFYRIKVTDVDVYDLQGEIISTIG